MQVTITSMDIEQLLDIDNFLINEGYEISSIENSSNLTGLNFGVPEILLVLEGIQKVLEIFFKIREFIQSTDESQNNVDNNVQQRNSVTLIISREDGSQIVLTTTMSDDKVQETVYNFIDG